ncbi:hypothetical protein GCM10018785_46220 [Streptomyces longispororuber]|uniref:Uncharacterized protein n=1 Tax=Streptomyces longispororuber TaxID=68230 RepID=A0A919DSS4_9ACTN|nr:hypothetical protein [Streptomyces longispororuber]GHE72778.1 hypothetical protein GCM10018785_46220 [Streptomyces longispororuber]
MTTAENRRRIGDWLARADPDPDNVWAQWRQHGVALIPLGRRFDAVRVSAERVHAAVGSDQVRAVADVLGAWLAGPVLRDLRSSLGPYYVLIAPGAAWDGVEERLSTDTYLGVPRPGHPTVLTRWIVEPRTPGRLCDARHLRALLRTADPLRAVVP